ncbi:MAG: MqnA/MqnD/SBP family protein [Planctomycetota bacterium]
MSVPDLPMLTLAHSPDSDDLVMWWPLVGVTDARGQPLEGNLGKPAIDTGGFRFDLLAEDVQALNRRAIERGDLDITAISAHAYPHLSDRYRITSCGGSFGEGYGPKLVAKRDDGPASLSDLAGKRLAVPGVHTTAYLTLQLLAHEAGVSPDAIQAVERPFEEVAGAVASGEADAGLLIHEAQLTIARDAELGVVLDLGAAWQEARGLPLPLGLNVIKRDLDDRYGPGSCARVSAILSASVEHAVTNPDTSKLLLRKRAHERPEWNDDALVDKYLSMYVSDLTRDMGEAGTGALEALLGEGARLGLCPHPGPIDLV